MKPKLSIIVPIYKQGKTIEKDLRRIKQVLNKLRYSSELIAVVDGYVDDSFKNASRVPGVKVVGYPTNKGKGHAVRFGMAKSRGNIIAFIDSGMDINPNGLSMILEHFEWYNADIIVGSKRHPVSKVNYPWQRRILSWGYQMGVRTLFGLNVRDTQVGLKCYRREVLEKVMPRLIVKNFAFDIEILAVAYHLGFKRIFEAPVEIELDFGKNSIVTSSKLFIFAYNMAVDTLAIFYRLHILRYYDDDSKRKWRFDPELNFRVNTT
ncbi:MAG: Glycosyl transferase, family 2 [Candidatus Amesbacteria bacterium GW2011_GWA2_47_11b]|uniref:Glycosyl transferase, family 2 n=2 Tax=Candidatus Amesiibacteriota TaxID=1752730 RepID=A0A0G1VJS9_9BACT|nr:MAG: Glycosyl transferase, family 2 [Candidatus Curtissbacteria bacterium GW2011_GWB1_40_28]KKU29394.1 MAG: Glycosyl transferase, family 2 [Microgenomates group bacterium GW2011_GWC1_46_20]KKU58496.1 MAG: Glycosyl transferase, family 2 [Candidatus Amesbacteria bacterium GW2011_GWA2_47_11b]KKU70335.1 MAG: Glycosyl transferase, family 2 [Candidatus Amesbacteria bacterium GW2011_GWA1_47_20]